MNTNNVSTQISSVQTEEEFDALLEIYKKVNPAKYALKLGNGDFDRYREKIAGKKVNLEATNSAEKVAEEVAVSAEKVAEEVAVPKRGRPAKI